MVLDPRDDYIARVVRNKSFADVGGLWGTVNEKVSIAHKSGASSLTMIDVLPLEHNLWCLFRDRSRSFELPEVRCISTDILEFGKSFPQHQFDVVHCSGMLYHMPNPLRFLFAMRRLAREYLILNSVVIPTKVETERGSLQIPQGAALFVPALQDKERDIIKSFWQQFVGDTAFGITRQTHSWNVEDFDPWWWLPTAETVKAMCWVAGFRCQDEAYFWNNNAYVQLLSLPKK